jgi:transcriptional regulator with XRE-family HTH domain
MITSEQMRAARALLRWEQKDLAKASKVSLPSIKRLEGIEGPLAAQERTIDAIIAAFGKAGLEFIDGDEPGVKLKAKGNPMFDVYENKSDKLERLIVARGAPIPAGQKGKEWVKLGTVPEVASDMKAEIQQRAFYRYKTNVPFDPNEIPGLPPQRP